MTECAFFGPEASFHHVGLAVHSIRDISPSSEILINETQGISFTFIRLHGMTIELLEPFGDRSPVARSLQNGVKLLHLCYEVPDLDAALVYCRRAGFHRLGPPTLSPAFESRLIVWVFSRQYGLFELVGRPAA